eukprot:jgi/Psemu1/243961/estExt_Genewise1.C_4060012
MITPGAAQSVISVHGSGTTNPSKCYWTIMDQMQIQSKNPIRMTYRAVGSSTGIAEFIGNGTVSENMFGSGDIPMSQEQFDEFPQGSFFHLPVLLGAITFFHSAPTGNEKLNLSPCTLAKILKREITDWGDDEIMLANPNLKLPKPSPITVAHRVKGSSSTASITQYLHQVCPTEWPEEMVGKTIEWNQDTIGCEGSGGMSSCIKEIPGTIGYIDMGHGHAEGLPEIELLNAAQKYISTKEAAALGGIMAAAENADLPETLEGSFAAVNLLNQGGSNTWPITAMTYVYVKKDLTFIEDPASQSLIKAFLNALYSDEYIIQCEEEFGFVRIGGELREKALKSIEEIVTSPGAPEWKFEFDTEKYAGQRDYVISKKRQSYSEIEQDKLVEMINKLSVQVDVLKTENTALALEVAEVAKRSSTSTSTTPSVSTSPPAARETTTNAFGAFIDDELDEDQQVKTALIMSSVSIALWVMAILGMIVKFASGSDSTTVPPAGASKPAEMMEAGMN